MNKKVLTKRQEYYKKYYQENKEKMKANVIRWREENPERYAELKLDIKERNKETARKRKKYMHRVKSWFGCAQCGYNEHPVALDFHHVIMEDDNVAMHKLSWASMDRIKREMRKCIILCANCHRIEHFGD
jgi:5-methylcytosine-specific restriction endonuclease McrA